LGDRIEQEVLAWYDESGDIYPLPETLVQQMRQQLMIERQRVETERQRAETERQRAERLAQYLRSQGIDPDQLPNA
jgi:hypothetical protein